VKIGRVRDYRWSNTRTLSKDSWINWQEVALKKKMQFSTKLTYTNWSQIETDFATLSVLDKNNCVTTTTLVTDVSVTTN